MGTVDDVLALEVSQLGVAEVPLGSNITPYTSWFGMRGAWCCMFQSWALYRCGVPFGPTGSKGFAWVSGAFDWLNRSDTPGQLVARADAQRGDLVGFEWGTTDGGLDHIGIIESRNGDTVYTIEGNTSDRVMRHARSLSRSGIAVVGRPAYSAPTPPPILKDWFDMATKEDLAKLLDEKLNAQSFGQLALALNLDNARPVKFRGDPAYYVIVTTGNGDLARRHVTADEFQLLTKTNNLSTLPPVELDQNTAEGRAFTALPVVPVA